MVQGRETGSCSKILKAFSECLERNQFSLEINDLILRTQELKAEV